MKTQNHNWKEDVEDLVEKVTFEEAHLAVQKLFEKALSQLAPDEQSILEAHWEGTSTKRLAHQLSLSPHETQELVNRLKTKLISHMQRSIRTRQ